MTPKMLRGIKTRAEHARIGADRTPPLPLPTAVDVAPPIRSQPPSDSGDRRFHSNTAVFLKGTPR